MLDDTKTTDAKLMLLARGRELCDSFAAVISANNHTVRTPFRVVLGGRDASSSAHRAFLGLSFLQKLFLTSKLVAASIGFASCTTEGLVAAYPSLGRVIVDEEALYLSNSILRLQQQMGSNQWRRSSVIVIAPRSHLRKIGLRSFNKDVGGRAGGVQETTVERSVLPLLWLSNAHISGCICKGASTLHETHMHAITMHSTPATTTKGRAREERKELKSVPDVWISFRSYLATLALFMMALMIVLSFQYLELSKKKNPNEGFGLGEHFRFQPRKPTPTQHGEQRFGLGTG